MRRFLTVVGMLFLFTLLGIGGLVAYVMHEGRTLDASSKAYVEANVPAIVSTWSKQALLDRAAPQLLKQIHKHPGQIDSMFDKLSSLGALKRLGEVQGESNLSYNLPSGKATIAVYVVRAVFAHGEAKIKLRLIRKAGQWKFLNFDVTAPAILKPQPEEQTNV